MGLNGPLQDPDSVRGQRAANREGVQEAPVQIAPDPPAWLTKAEQVVFRELVDQAIKAKTPMLEVDGHAFGIMTQMIVSIRKEKDASVKARIARSLLPWMQAAGLNPMGRARLGVKQTERKKSETTRLLEMRKSL